jgi:hypothetical protein
MTRCEVTDNKTIQKLVKICGMLGSAYDGERAAAALMATQIINDLDLSWEDVIVSAFSLKPQPKVIEYDGRGAGWHVTYCAWLLNNKILDMSSWEVQFIQDLHIRYGSLKLTKKQSVVFVRIVKKYGVEM